MSREMNCQGRVGTGWGLAFHTESREHAPMFLDMLGQKIASRAKRVVIFLSMLGLRE